MSSQDAAPQCRPAGGAATGTPASVAPEEFEFCVLPSGSLAALAGEEEDGMCFADEVFSDGKLLPLRLSSANSVDAPAALRLLRSDSLDGATTALSANGFSSRSDSRSASSSSSSSSSVSRSTSQKSASSDGAGRSGQPSKTASSALAPPRRPLSGSLFYAHPSPSPRPSQRWTGCPAAPAPAAAAAAARRSTGSAPPASWGLLRLGVVGAPDVYPPRPAAARGGSRSARFEQPSAAAKDAVALDKKLPLGFLGAGLVCSCSPDAVEPVGSAEVAAAARRRRRRKAAEKNTGKVKSGQSTVRRSRILEWLEEPFISKEKTAA